tara:strand:+ start:122 stop:400 length:279 start_codon:yes stop_codon:yes gene_type:complete
MAPFFQVGEDMLDRMRGDGHHDWPRFAHGASNIPAPGKVQVSDSDLDQLLAPQTHVVEQLQDFRRSHRWSHDHRRTGRPITPAQQLPFVFGL